MALVRAARSTSERYKQTDLSILEKGTVETYAEKLNSVCAEYGELIPSKTALTVQKHGIWLSGVAGPLRAAIGGLWHRWRYEVRAYIVNHICPEYYRLLDPNTGLLRSGKNREDAIQDVLQALWDLKEKEKAAKQVKKQRAGPVKTKLHLGSGEDTVPDDSQDVECGEDGNSEYGSVEEGLSVDGEVDGADEPMER